MSTADHSNDSADRRTVSLVTLGCARNEVDSEELAARLESTGWTLDDSGDASVVLVNTCGFIAAAKKDSIDTLLAAADSGARVVAAGCLAERYGAELAESLPEADAVLSFDDYASIGERLDDVLAGRGHRAHTPQDRRKLLPLSPVERSGADVRVPGHGDPPADLGAPDLPEGIAPASGPRVLRRRLGGGPAAPLKLASGCDRRCTFCAIPAFRGAYVSRRPTEILDEARWLASQGVREIVLVSENSTSYGKDLGDIRLLETLLPELAALDGIERVRVSYLQPAELRPGLIEAIATTPGVVPYFDLSFQHASGPLLRRMRRFGDRERFLGLLEQIRALAPEAGVRSNFIVGFPGETEQDVDELAQFLTAARLDAIGVFGYSDEEGTEAVGFDGKLDADEIDARVADLSSLAEELTAQRAEERIGSVVEVLVEEPGEGRAAHQAPEIDGGVTLKGDAPVGRIVRARVVEAMGVDLLAVVDGP
ncbi:30S ribosomal protein S12 methylthiotransferase RimO [Actinoallomurus purpureus]|uniref:30S ribosomal protein S12 methylthiotransferase RimO n=1 Tax=Actinoallomurus purpureus TaxID=478114 RepID=UPI00209206DD|nr:30S ribosomal protein S12 methylthiotransferase RimO [Actinoallomurus purpureus]MCO6006413.1 30S ribosomal protein S12 methylthiotransferase RimO [Actinoallomurus purpureus]